MQLNPRHYLALRRSPLMRDVPDAAIVDFIRRFPMSRYAAGESLFRDEEAAQDAYLILEGRCQIALPGSSSGDIPRRIVGSGEFVGEIAVFTGGRRSAKALVVEDVVCLRVSRDALLDLLRAWPEIALGLLRIQCERLLEAETLLHRGSATLPR